MKTIRLLLLLSLCCASTTFAQRMCLSKVYSPYSETKYTYGDDDKVILVEDNSDIDMQFKYTYNDQNQCIREEDYQLVDTEWIFASYILYTYDEKGNLATRVNYNYDPSAPDGHSRAGLMSYIYDENNHLITELTDLYIGGDETMPFMRRSFTYDESGKLQKVVYEDNDNWGPGAATWVESIKGDYSYDENGKLIADSTFLNDIYGSGEWVYNEKHTYTYDKNGNMILHEYYSGNSSGTGWNLSSFEEYEYDTAKSAAEYVYPESHEMIWPRLESIVNERTKEISHQLDDSGEMQLYDTYTYEYAVPTNITEMIVSDPTLICPNPVKESFTLNLSDETFPVYIYDAEGRLKVMFSNAKGSLNVSELSSGIYLLKCGQHSTKLVKE